MGSDEVVEAVLSANRAFSSRFPGEAPVRPRRGLAVVACMDTRIDVAAALDLPPGDAHIIRNAGGIVSDDVIRSLTLSQRVLGTDIVLVVQHSDCGLEGLSDTEFLSGLEEETGQRPKWAPGGFRRVDDSLRASLRRLEESPFLQGTFAGYVYETDTGRLRPPAV